MPINESNRPQRVSAKDQEQYMPQNHFAVDYNTETIMDINKPPQKRYVHQDFPRFVYNHDSGQVLRVDDDRQLKAAQKKGFDLKPDTRRDYSTIGNVVLDQRTNEFSAGIAPMRAAASARQELQTAAQLVEE